MKKGQRKNRAERGYGGVSNPYPEMESEGADRMLLPVAFSLVCHAVLLVILVFMPQPSFEKTYAPTVIDVRMVSMGDIGAPASSEPEAPAAPAESELPRESGKVESPPAETKAASAAPEPEAPVVRTEEKSPPPAAEPEVSLAPKEERPEKEPERKTPKKIKRSLKEKTYRPSEIVKNAIEKLERRTEESPRPKSVLDAIAKLRKEVEEEKPRRPAPSGDRDRPDEPKPPAGSAGAGSGTGAGVAGAGGAMGGMFDVYKVEVAYRIQRNWAFSDQLAGKDGSLETLVGIRIGPDGRIADVWFDKKSGNRYLDDSAIRAVKKSNPLPPLPKDFRGRFFETGLRFTPKGLAR